MKFSRSHDSSHTKIFGLFNIVWPKKSPADPPDISADQPAEPSVYQEIISAEAYIRHTHAERRLRTISSLISALLVLAVFTYVLATVLAAITYATHQDVFREWDVYLSGKYIDVTPCVKDFQEILVPTNRPHIYNAYTNATFSYSDLVAIDQALQESDSEVAAIYKSASGFYVIFKINRDIIHDCVINGADFAEQGIFSTTPISVNTASSDSFLICLIQDVSLIVHDSSSIGSYLAFTIAIALGVLVVIYVLIQMDYSISVHESYLSRLAPVDIYHDNTTSPSDSEDSNSSSKDSTSSDDVTS